MTTTASRASERDGQRCPEAPKIEVQQDLFDDFHKKFRRPRRKKRKGPYIKGLQYKLRMQVRATPRKIKRRAHALPETDGNDFVWDHSSLVEMHSTLLWESLEQVKALCSKKSPAVAEILDWIRRDVDEPFSFEACCELFCRDVEGELLGAQDPAILRRMVNKWVKDAFGTDELPHKALLRQAVLDAESGDPDAKAWINSKVDGALSFVDCCTALGFNPNLARKSIHIPVSPEDTLHSQAETAA